MKTKIIGIFIVMLLIGTAIPIVNSADKNDSIQLSNEVYFDDCGCGSNRGIGIELIKKSNKNDPPNLTIMSVPDYFNWKDFGGQDWTTPAKNQAYPEYCGSCWAHATLGAFESNINIKEGSAVIDPDLSEQYLLSCLPEAAYPTPGEGCNGGSTDWAMKLMMEETPEGNYHNGALLEECFPYQADDDIPCDEKCPDWVGKLVPLLDWGKYLGILLMKFIKCHIMEKGPSVTTMYYNNDFETWEMTHHDPDDYYPYYKATEFNHVVVIVGWKDDPFISKGGYWICKDSFGTERGYNGFFNIEYGSLYTGVWMDWIDYDPESYEWPNEPNPPSSPMITGVTNGNISTDYEYTFNSVDPEGNDLKYYISWGDGDSEWTDYYPSGEDVTIKHTYNRKGDYSVVALAMNTDGNIGSWGTLYVIMPRNRLINNPMFIEFIEGFMDRFPLFARMLKLL